MKTKNNYSSQTKPYRVKSDNGRSNIKTVRRDKTADIYNSKWSKVNVSKKERKRIYDRCRLEAKQELKKRHIHEYNIILKRILKREYADYETK